MTSGQEELERLVHTEFCKFPDVVAQRMLTKALAKHPNLAAAEQARLRHRLEEAVLAHLAQAADASRPAANEGATAAPPTPSRPFPAITLAEVEDLVARVMSAPIDGSLERFEILAKRARATFEARLASLAPHDMSRDRLTEVFAAALEEHRRQMVTK